MSPPADPLRNTLDELALDPRAKDDRRYLVSVLRRLGYTETEIREALGGPRGGEEGRLIEVEYTGKRPAVITDEPSGEQDEGTFTVVSEEPEFEHDEPEAEGEWTEEWEDESTEALPEAESAPEAEGEEPAAETWEAPEEDETEWQETGETAEWDDDAWDPETTQETEEVVEFIERAPEAEAEASDAWSEAPLEEAAGDDPWAEQNDAAPWQDEGAEEAPSEDERAERVEFSVARGGLDEQEVPDAHPEGHAWEDAEPSEEWAAAESTEEEREAAPEDVAVQAGWQPVSEEELEASFAEEPAYEAPAQDAPTEHDARSADSGDMDDWGRPDEAPGGSWEPAEQTAEDWDAPADEWEAPADDWPEQSDWPAPKEDWSEPEEDWEAETGDEDDGPFTLDDYTLYTREVELSNGSTQSIYFFAKDQPKSGTAAALPAGYAVERNPRTGLPYLRRTEGAGKGTAEKKTKKGKKSTKKTPSKSPAKSGGKTAKSGGKAAKAAADRCPAVTKSGSQCKNHPRGGSKYCGVHKGWRGPRVDA